MAHKNGLSFFNDFLSRPVLDELGVNVGSVADLAVRVDRGTPVVTHLLVRGRKGPIPWTGQRSYSLPWLQVDRLELSAIRLRGQRETFATEPVLTERILLNRQLLDHQILDADGKKLLRVNDVRLQIGGDGLRVVGVETGIGSLLRRLGVPRQLPTVARRLGWHVPPSVIPWGAFQRYDPRRRALQLRADHSVFWSRPPR